MKDDPQDTSPDYDAIREIVKENSHAETRIYRLAEAMEFDPDEVYRALTRVQQGYEIFEAAETRPIVAHGKRWVAFGANGYDWHHLIGYIKQDIDDEQSDYIVKVVLQVMSDIAATDWRTHHSVVLAVPEHKLDDVLSHHNETYDPDARKQRN